MLIPGFVVETNANVEMIKKFISDHHPTTMLFINNVDLASVAADLHVPNVILRIKTDSINDNELHILFRDAKEWWDAVKHHYNDKRFIVYCGNELNGDWNRINRFLSDAVDIIEVSGRRGVYGNFGVGNPEPQYWSTFLSELVAKLNTKPNQYMGIHEYYIKHPFLGVDGYSWQGDTLVDATPQIPMQTRVKWILGRYETLLRVAPNVQIMVTEFGADHVTAIAKQYNFPESMRGWDSQYNGDEVAALEHFRLALNTFFTNRNIHGILFFIIGGFGWEDFDFTNANIILNRWQELKVNIPMGTAVNKLVEIRARASSYNMRFTAPSGQIVGQTSVSIPNWTIVSYLEYEDDLDASGQRWSKYSGLRLASGSIGSAWIRDDGVERRDFVNPDIPPDSTDQFLTIPIPELYYSGLTDREKEIALAMLRWTELSAKSLADYIESGIE